MWKRRTLHECAEELAQISENFRLAYMNRLGLFDPHRRQQSLESSSIRGVEVLRILALAVRSEQDANTRPRESDSVGVLLGAASPNDVFMALNHYQPSKEPWTSWRPLALREAFNKIAHANPARAGFFADEESHDLILTGDQRGVPWIAVMSIVRLCAAVCRLPDQDVHGTEADDRSQPSILPQALSLGTGGLAPTFLEVDVDGDGWTRCPTCGWRCKISDSRAFTNATHNRCGQPIRVRRAGS